MEMTERITKLTPPPSPLQDMLVGEVFGTSPIHGMRRPPAVSAASEDGGDMSQTMDVLHKFRMAMRDVGAHTKGAASFVEALRAHFTGQVEEEPAAKATGTPSAIMTPGSPAAASGGGRNEEIHDSSVNDGSRGEQKVQLTRMRSQSNRSKTTKSGTPGTMARSFSSVQLKNPLKGRAKSILGSLASKKVKEDDIVVLHESELRKRIHFVLRDTDLSFIDTGEIFEAIDQDGSGTVEWEEFLSFLSLSPSSLHRIAVRLQESLKKASKEAASFNDFYQSLTLADTMADASKGHALIPDFTEKDLERYMVGKLHAIRLTPGELHWLYTEIGGEQSQHVGELELRMFIRSYKPTMTSSEDTPVVDITVSASLQDATDLEHLHYHRIPINMNGGEPIFGNAFHSNKHNKSRGDPIFIWYRTASIDDFVDETALQRARVTDIMVNSHNRDAILTKKGYCCIEPSLTSGGKGKGKHQQYIWIRRNPSDPHPVLNIAATSGNANDIRDNIHFPPFAGFKLTEPMHNVNPRGGKKGHKDVFLWYRKSSFDHEILGVVDIPDPGDEKAQHLADSHDLSTRLARPPSMWNTNQYRHVFTILDQLKQVRIVQPPVTASATATSEKSAEPPLRLSVDRGQLQNRWVHTHRWNHGLESVYDMSVSAWADPVIPTVSLYGLNTLMERLDETHVLLDIDGRTFKQVMGNVVTEAVDRGLVPESMRIKLLHTLRMNADNRVSRRRHLKEARSDPLMQDPEEDAVHMMVGEVDFLDADVDDDDDDDDVGNSSRDSSSGGGGSSSTTTTAAATTITTATRNSHSSSKDEVHSGGVYKNDHHRGNQKKSNLLLFVRTALPVDIGRDETNARFFVIILGNSSRRAQLLDTQIGVSFASLLQDEKVVGAAYKARTGSTLIDALRMRLRDIHMVPQLHRPTGKGMEKRTRRLDRLLGRLGEHHAWRTNQHDRWLERQGDTLSKGLTLANMWAFLQKYAIPLLLGITVALIWSNTDYASYDKYCSAAHHGALHGSDYGSNATNSSNATAGHRRMLLESFSSSSAMQLVDPASIKPSILGLSFNGHEVTLNFIVNDVLMALFFGLAVKEITEALMPGGSLHPVNKAINPLIGTFGGVVGPIVMYFIVIAVQDSMGVLSENATFADVAIGWGIPTATDISLAWVTALICFGRGHPAIQHLLLLAIVDDAIGLIIIAVAYTDTSNGPPFFGYLPLVPLGMLIAYALRKMDIMRWELYVMFAGPVTWFGLIMSSLHPALALAFVVPFMPTETVDERLKREEVEEKRELRRIRAAKAKADLENGSKSPRGQLSRQMSHSTFEGTFDDDDERDGHDGHEGSHHHSHAPLHQFEDDLKWFVDCVVLFLFGLCNAGVQLDGIGQLTISILVALMIGKTLGIGLCTLFAVKVLGIELPRGMGMREIWLLGFIASIGLTVALFVAGEAFRSEVTMQKEAKMGALLSVASGVIAIICASTCPSVFTTPVEEFEEEDSEDEDEDEELQFEDMDSDNDDEDIDAVIVNSMLHTLKIMRKNVREVEKRSGMKRHALIKRYQHARKRIMSHGIQQRKRAEVSYSAFSFQHF
jgi:NhaA family Na+:H+ antiporter